MWTSGDVSSTLGWILPGERVEELRDGAPARRGLPTVTAMNSPERPSADGVAPPAATSPTAPASPATAGTVATTPPTGTAGRAFHQLGAAPGARGWRPLLVLLLAAGCYVVSWLALVVLAVVLDAVTGAGIGERVVSLDLADPVAFVAAFTTIAWMLPSLLLARRLVGLRPVGLLSSVTGRLRWRWLGRALLISATVYLVGFALQLVVVDPLTGVPLPPAGLVPAAWVFLLGAVLLVPLQAAAEEYVFRGGLMQAVGGWLRHPVFAVVLPVPLFVVGHGYDLLGQTGIAVFALLTGWITWRTGGLEAAIALHVVNNSLLTVIQALGWADPNATAVTAPALVVSVLVQVVASWFLVRSADRLGVERRSAVTAC